MDEKRELTPLGRDLARLPIDPTLGRMLLQSQHEHATRELLIIAARMTSRIRATGLWIRRKRPTPRTVGSSIRRRIT